MSGAEFTNVITRLTAAPNRSVLLRQYRVVIRSGANKGQTYILCDDCVRIGKSPGNDIVLPDDTVSRQHCELVRDRKGFLLRDLGSTNGTFINGSEIHEAYVGAGATFKVGTIDIVFEPADENIEVPISESDHFGELYGQSQAMREVFGLLARVAATEARVLLQGETGTGKELAARAMHDHSKRADKPFVVVDCSAIARSVIESELFGHEKGAFTSADAPHVGAFERAHGGTVFLDELAELSLELQPKLLRVLERREIQRVGGGRTVPVDFRLIAATNRDLQEEVAKGKFRDDLYFRVAVVPVYLPPLRFRREDIRFLSERFLTRLGDAAPLPEHVLAQWAEYDWPGNVRELRNTVERGFYLSHAQSVATLTGRKSVAVAEAQPPAPTEFDPALSFSEAKQQVVENFEKAYAEWILSRAEGNVSQAARDARMDRKHLHGILTKYGLDR